MILPRTTAGIALLAATLAGCNSTEPSHGPTVKAPLHYTVSAMWVARQAEVAATARAVEARAAAGRLAASAALTRHLLAAEASRQAAIAAADARRRGIVQAAADRRAAVSRRAAEAARQAEADRVVNAESGYPTEHVTFRVVAQADAWLATHDGSCDRTDAGIYCVGRRIG